MSAQMMKCGHAAQGTARIDGVDIPACIICAGTGVGADAYTPEPETVDWSKRRMRCTYNHGAGCAKTPHGGNCCKPDTEGQRVFLTDTGREVYSYTRDADGCEPSNPAAAFFARFEHEAIYRRPSERFTAEIDSFFCGCWGWD